MAQGRNPLFHGIAGRVGGYSVYPQNGQTRLRVRSGSRRNNGDSQVQYQCGVRDVARAWSQTPVKTKVLWGKLAARMPRWDAQTAQTPLTGYQAFQSVAWGLKALEKGIPAVPLAVPDLPQSLPDVTLSATLTGNVLRLTVGGGPFPDACQIFACKPAVPGAKCTHTWSQIVVVQNWNSDLVEIGESYAAHFGVPQDGAEVWLKLVPISQNGFRGQPLVRSVEVEQVNIPAPEPDGTHPRPLALADGTHPRPLPKREGCKNVLSFTLPVSGRDGEGLSSEAGAGGLAGQRAHRFAHEIADQCTARPVKTANAPERRGERATRTGPPDP